MTVFELLARQHVEVETGFRDIHAALERKDHGTARSLFSRLSTRLLASMRSEHAVVYPAFAYHAGLDDEVKRAIREHGKIEQSINQLRLVPLAPEAWRGALTRLQILVAEHLETEEWILFPVARLRLTTAQTTKLAAEYLAFEAIALPTTRCSITYDAGIYDAGIYDAGTYDTGTSDAGVSHLTAATAASDPGAYNASGFDAGIYDAA